jgi:hypothetical protein
VVLTVFFLTVTFVVTNGNLMNPNVFGDSELIIKIKGAIDGMKAPNIQQTEENLVYEKSALPKNVAYWKYDS